IWGYVWAYEEAGDKWAPLGRALNSTSRPSPEQMYEDKQGRMWVRSGRGVPRFKYLDSGHWPYADDARPPVSINDRPVVLFCGRNGDLWFVSRSSLVKYDGEQWGATVAVPKAIDAEYAGLAVRYASDADADFAGQRNSFDALVRRQDGRPAAATDTVSCGLEDRQGNIWLGARRGIIRFDYAKKAWTALPLPDKLTEIRRIYEDRIGRLWFADDR